ncbi:MAG: hypothetical protein D9N14_00510 [Ketobacter sp.]|nr:MAG: hypothetical protein D9N14_00510 [Ketobacter sp.]
MTAAVPIADLEVKVTRLLGYVFLLAGIALLVVGVNQLGLYVQAPDQFPIYQKLVALPAADRTIDLQQGAMVLPVGFFKVSGMLSILLTGFLLVSVVKLLVSTGLGMIKSDTRDLARQLISEIRKLEHRDLNG